jgi:hypothetical protein
VLALLGALRRRGAHASRASQLALASLCFVTVAFASRQAAAVSSAEYYSATSYGYGRFEARLRFAAGDGVVSSFFLWKVGSEMTGAFWNELDFEKVGAACEVRSNANFGSPPPFTGGRTHPLEPNPCETYHTYAYEWTPDAIAWLVDGVELRRETGATATAFAENATAGMQIRFNVWPGDATFGGNFSPDILPVHQYVDWVQFSSYEDGTFTLGFREDFDGALPSVWATGNWGSPKNLSTHAPGNVNIVDGHLVLSLTEDGAIGPAGALPDGSAGTAGAEGSAPRSASACSFGTTGREGSRAFLGALVAAVFIALGRRWRSNRK